MRELPVLFKEKSLCTGCAACFNACASNAIRMVEDSEGFEYPEIDEKIYIRCLKCLKAAPCRNE